MKKMNTRPVPATASKREDIIRIAYSVFDEHGFVETGIDKVFADSGISKRTVYKYFASKEELIAAAILYYQTQAFEEIRNSLEARAKTPKEKLLALFELKREELQDKEYSGCFAINAGLSYRGKNKLIENASCTFLRETEKMIAGLCREAGCPQPEVTAMQIMILFQGTILHGQSHRDPAAAAAAKKAAQELLR